MPWRYVPNVITSIRLLMATVILVLVGCATFEDVSPAYLDVTLGLFLLAMGTDWLDGFVARRMNAVSHLGRILDPFVDKVLICGLFILFSSRCWSGSRGAFSGVVDGSGVAPWMAVVVVIRELMISMLRSFEEGSGRDYSALWSGKAKLVVQTVAIAVVLLILAHLRSIAWAAHVRDSVLIAAVLTTAASAFPYLKVTLKRLVK